ncbi:MAG: GWxTD domain-containing protein [Bryobacteraceae bacterium]|nr:GWxTD domain-containing protein [Bryobacteraceae bacterium]
MRTLLAITFICSAICATSPAASAARDLWLTRVEAVINTDERTRYLSLSSEEERESFREAFWNGKAVSGAEYFERAAYTDTKFGSGQTGSGVNTDQGRVYVALGPPTQTFQLPFSRLLQPLEIWRYDHIPGIPVSSEIQLLFFQPRGVGLMKLYSPQIHTIRALLINNAGTRGAFGVNEIATAADLPNRLQLSPVELQAVDAAIGVARGVTGSGNSELLYRLSSPAAMLRRETREKVQSRIVTATGTRPQFTTVQVRTSERIPAIELTADVTVKEKIGVEINGIESVETKLNFAEAARISYRHRLYLLPGSWNVTLISDGQRTLFPTTVHALTDQDPVASADLLPEADSAGIPVIYRANLRIDSQWTSVGRQYLHAGVLDRALLCYQKALRSNPSSPDALAGMGKLYALQGKLDQARTDMERALQIQPEHYEAIVGLAGVASSFGDTTQALAYYRQAQAIRPSGEILAAMRQITATTLLNPGP